LISYREEREKLNVWVAWLNLENLHGSPPDEAVMRLFQRALPQTDPKKLYLSLLTILERSGRVSKGPFSVATFPIPHRFAL
jgi:rRNA biogenesis protein RRP5